MLLNFVLKEKADDDDLHIFADFKSIIGLMQALSKLKQKEFKKSKKNELVVKKLYNNNIF